MKRNSDLLYLRFLEGNGHALILLGYLEKVLNLTIMAVLNMTLTTALIANRLSPFISQVCLKISSVSQAVRSSPSALGQNYTAHPFGWHSQFAEPRIVVYWCSASV